MERGLVLMNHEVSGREKAAGGLVSSQEGQPEPAQVGSSPGKQVAPSNWPASRRFCQLLGSVGDPAAPSLG